MVKIVNIEKIRKTQELILQVLYNHWRKEIVPYEFNFPTHIEEKYKDIYNETLDRELFNIAFEDLIKKQLISKKKGKTITKDGITQNLPFITIESIGVARVFPKEIDKTFKRARDYTDKAIAKFKAEHNRFYAKLIEIFGIFVAIFSFIVVGFSQYISIINQDISLRDNLIYIITIFLLLVLILVILLWMVEGVVKSINKPVYEYSEHQDNSLMKKLDEIQKDNRNAIRLALVALGFAIGAVAVMLYFDIVDVPVEAVYAVIIVYAFTSAWTIFKGITFKDKGKNE